MDVVKGPDNHADLISQWIISYEKDLLRLCCVCLGDLSLAEDAVQETFLKAYRHLPSFHGESSPRTWLVRIALNVCKDMRRTSWFRLLRHSVELDRVKLPAPPGNLEIHSALMAEIMRLPRPCKEVVLLYHYEEFTQAEIAHTLRISIATVHRRLRKAYALLENELKGGSPYEAT